MKILLTGATGFIGRQLARQLRDAGHDVCALVRTSSNTTELVQDRIATLVDDGTSDLRVLLDAGGPFHGVIHLASVFRVAHRTEEIVPMLSANVVFATRLLDAAVRHGVLWFVNTGTTWQHYQDHNYSPVNLYAATKQAFESVAQYYVEAHKLPFVTLVLTDTYGPCDPRSKLLNLWCRAIATGVPLEMSDGIQELDLVYSADVVAAYLAVIGHLANDRGACDALQTFTVSSGVSLSLRELARVFGEATGKEVPIRWGVRPARPREVMVPWQGGVSVPGWAPAVTLQTGLASLWQAFCDGSAGNGAVRT